MYTKATKNKSKYSDEAMQNLVGFFDVLIEMDFDLKEEGISDED